MEKQNMDLNNNQNIKNIVISILALIVLAFGVGLMVKPEVGLGPWDALTATISELTGLKFGTASIVSNIVMIFLQLIILRKRFKLSYWIQVPIVFSFGYVINFFLYQVLQFNLTDYCIRMLLFAFGNIVAAFAISFLVIIDIIAMPPEIFSSAVAKVTGFEFSNIRLALDIVSVIICLLSYWLLSTTLQIREGTIVSIIVFNISIKIFIKLLEPLIKNKEVKYNYK